MSGIESILKLLIRQRKHVLRGVVVNVIVQ